MPKEINITQDQLNSLSEFYLRDCLTNREISKKIGQSVNWVLKKLKDYNLFIELPEIYKTKRAVGAKLHKSQRIQKWTKRDFILTVKEEEKVEVKLCFIEGVDYVAVCKKTNKRLKDYLNKGGGIKDHIDETYPDYVHESNFKKRKYKKITGEPWYYGFFEFIVVEKDVKETVSCEECGWETSDYLNAGGWLTKHVRDEHKHSATSYIEKFPNQRELFATPLEKEAYRRRFETEYAEEGRDYVICKECNKRVSKINNKHLSKHNMTLIDYKIKHGLDDISSESFIQKTLDNYEANLKYYEGNYTSKAQQEIIDICTSIFGDEVLSNNKSILDGTELDVVIPSKKLAIEYNGLYYHSEISGKKPHTYHLDKTKKAKQKGYKLIHVFEDEWESRKELVKTKLLRILGEAGESIERVHARKCIIKEIHVMDKNEFLRKYHIQSEDKSNIHLGAYDQENRLISVMTLDTKRVMSGKHEELEAEIRRFAIRTNIVCVGVMGKFISFIKREYEFSSLLSFADIRWTPDSEDNIYNKNGFYLEHTTRPDYQYYNDKIGLKRLSKYPYGKKSLKIKFPKIYSDKKSEWDIMQEAGFDRVWDCGKYRFRLRF